MSQQTQRVSVVKKVTLIGALVNATLGFTKVILGSIGHSHALVADGIHSFSDLLTDVLVIVATVFGSREADSDHPYGHGRIETAATMFLAMLLVLVGAGIIYDAAIHIFIKNTPRPEFIVLIAALFSIAANEGLFHYTKWAGKKIHSALLMANAWHHRSDALSSIVVFMAVGGELLGIPYLDGIAAVVVGCMVIKMGGQLAWGAIRELVDTGLEPEQLINIKNIINTIPGVIELHQLRTRSTGGNILIDVHVLVSPKISVSEGHHIGDSVQYALRNKLSNISDIIVHIDSEDDESIPQTTSCPSRAELMPLLEQAWQELPYYNELNDVRLHYANNQIEIECVFNLKETMQAHTAQDIKIAYKNAIKKPFIRDLTFHFKM